MSEEFLGVDEMRARGYDSLSLETGKVVSIARKEAGLLIAAIHEAFRNIPRPQTTLHVARGLDDEWHLSDERFRELRAMDPEEDWTELLPDRMDGFTEYFTFSDDEGWRFYLPAFMCRYLEQFPGRAGHNEIYWACVSKDHVALLNEEQMACVERFVTLCHRYEKPDGGMRMPPED